jgi:transcriptional regulator with XRE-family HTH domain
VNLKLKEYRLRRGLTQTEAAEAIRQRALARGDGVVPGLDRSALSRHERGVKRPTPYYRTLYCEVYGATPAELGFRLALPGETGHPDDVDRREFLTSAAGFIAAAALPPAPTRRLGHADIVRVRQSITHLYELDDQHGAGSVYTATARTFLRLHALAEHASYDATTGQALQELTGLAAEHAGWLAFDAGQHDDARRWYLEALYWARLADSERVGVVTMAAMAWAASDQGRPREAVQLATAAQSTAGRVATPRLNSMLLAREALGHAGRGDATSAHDALHRARGFIDVARDDEPSWITFYGPANFASNECCVALILGDTAAAGDAARTALALNDPVAFPRNHALYLVRLANVLVERREVDEAAAAVKQATIAAAGLDSARVNAGVQATTQRLSAFNGELL